MLTVEALACAHLSRPEYLLRVGERKRSLPLSSSGGRSQSRSACASRLGPPQLPRGEGAVKVPFPRPAAGDVTAVTPGAVPTPFSTSVPRRPIPLPRHNRDLDSRTSTRAPRLAHLDTRTSTRAPRHAHLDTRTSTRAPPAMSGCAPMSGCAKCSSSASCWSASAEGVNGGWADACGRLQ